MSYHSFSILVIVFIGLLTLVIILYIGIPYFSRKKTTKRRQQRLSRKANNFIKVSEKYSTNKIKYLMSKTEKLETDLKSNLIHIAESKNREDLEFFYSNFEKVYPDFKIKLLNYSNKLSSNDLKLAALIRLNLCAKEIASILNISPDSVHKARYRLRKKLGLKPKENLSAFILNI
ncbi:hypothetical protein [Winogradskyella sp.]|uniref:helix-turn-helix transcriptional regulator n=1 Tax=Winogradskyella sp. TaxID=1883156 RepID=UPI0025CDEB28|nr:hypothetical protein [Winogradskyella sp.]MBT8244905.1 hypothetical protein [Winogradskyella sp.]